MQKEIKSSTIDFSIGEYESSSPKNGFSPNNALHSKYVKSQETLVSQLEENSRTIDNLNALIDAITPMPGFDADKYRRIILAKNSGDTKSEDIDHRDSKIVSLAKKCRNLTVQYNKEKSDADRLHEQMSELNSMNDRLREELSLAQRSNAKERSSTGPLSEAEGEIAKKELNIANKSLEEMRRKLTQSKEECKNLKAALVKEVGDGVSLEEAVSMAVAVDGNWRGRAQQIVMLKSKIRKLEQQATKATTATNVSRNGYPNEDQQNVDTKAENVISEMGNERKQMIETITEEHKNLTIQNKELEGKVTSYKARIRNIEGELQKFKQHIQVVLEKTDSDDQLVEALRNEVQRLKELLRNQQQAAAAAANDAHIKTAFVHANTMNISNNGDRDNNDLGEVNRLRADLLRLERICKTQAEQLTTQDFVIKELRKNKSSY